MRKMCTDYRQNEDLRLVALELNTSNTLKTIAFWGINVFNGSRWFKTQLRNIENIKNKNLLGD